MASASRNSSKLLGVGYALTLLMLLLSAWVFFNDDARGQVLLFRLLALKAEPLPVALGNSVASIWLACLILVMQASAIGCFLWVTRLRAKRLR